MMPLTDPFAPLDLFLFILAGGLGLFVMGVLGLLLYFFWCALKGFLSEDPDLAAKELT